MNPATIYNRKCYEAVRNVNRDLIIQADLQLQRRR